MNENFIEPFCDGNISCSQNRFNSLTRLFDCRTVNTGKKRGSLTLNHIQTTFCQAYLNWNNTVQAVNTVSSVCKRRQQCDLCFCETVCYPLINSWIIAGKHSKTNLSLALKMDYFFHVMFSVYNKEIIPLMKKRLEPTLKQFMHCNRISLIITGILQLHYTIALRSLFKTPLWVNPKLIIITMPETKVFTYKTRHL